MAVRFHGATYLNRDHIKDQHLQGALDDIASQIQAVVQQGNFSKTGVTAPPPAPAALNVSNSSGLYTATVTHNNPPVGTHWKFQYSTDPNFQTPVGISGSEQTVQPYLPNQKLYWRVAAYFATSQLTPWIYFGGTSNPTAV